MNSSVEAFLQNVLYFPLMEDLVSCHIHNIHNKKFISLLLEYSYGTFLGYIFSGSL